MYKGILVISSTLKWEILAGNKIIVNNKHTGSFISIEEPPSSSPFYSVIWLSVSADARTLPFGPEEYNTII